MATILQRLSQAFSVGNMVVSIFEPASERGNNAVEELRQQTINIFSFQKIPKTVFDSQLAFNLLSQLGEDAKEPLISFRTGDCKPRQGAAKTRFTAAEHCPYPGARVPLTRILLLCRDGC